MSNDRDFTPEEAARLALVAPELAGSTRAELNSLIKRYGESDPALKALVAGQPTVGSMREAREETEEAALIQRHYPSARRQLHLLTGDNYTSPSLRPAGQ